MKKLLFLTITCLMASLGFAQDQDNPYAIFGYKPKAEVKENKNDVYRVKNSDLNSKIKFLEIERDTKTIKLINDNGLVVQRITMTDDMLLRWVSIDPLSDKYPQLSPYNYVSNNPMNTIDPDGQDGVKVIDKENRTITIKANYYVETQAYKGGYPIATYSEGQMKSLQGMSATLNKAGYTITEGEYKDYKVNFDLQFIAGGNGADLKGLADADKFQGVQIGNTFQKGDDAMYKRYFPTVENADGTTTTVGGVTINHQNILMNTANETGATRTHEVFHTLFFDQDNAKSGIGRYPPQKPNQADINKLIYNPLLPGVPVPKKEDEKKP